MVQILGHSHRTRDRRGDIGDAAVLPRPDLVAEDAEPSRPSHSHRAFGHDTSPFAVQVGDRSLFDHEATFRHLHNHCRVVQVAARASLCQRADRFEHFPAGSHNMRTGAQRNPVEVDGSMGIERHVASLPAARDQG